jgi:hypothetical protein
VRSVGEEVHRHSTDGAERPALVLLQRHGAKPATTHTPRNNTCSKRGRRCRCVRRHILDGVLDEGAATTGALVTPFNAAFFTASATAGSHDSMPTSCTAITRWSATPHAVVSSTSTPT